jgi:hypothetical protein
MCVPPREIDDGADDWMVHLCLYIYNGNALQIIVFLEFRPHLSVIFQPVFVHVPVELVTA